MAAASTPANLAHLYRRAAFGTDRGAIDAAAADGIEATVDLLLAAPADVPGDPPAPVFEELDESLRGRGRDLSEDEQLELQRERQRIYREGFQDLVTWWIGMMATSPQPQVEKTTFILHDHFATGIEKVKVAEAMYNQNLALRAWAFGSFPDLVQTIAKDPAMIFWLDLQSSTADNLNENFGRELLELFTLGAGNYSQEDVREVSRAFTGWTLVGRTQSQFRARRHDSGEKTVLGETGTFDGEDIVALVTSRRESAEWIAAEFWSKLAYPDPEAAVVTRLADAYEAGGRRIDALLRAIYTDDAFYSPAALNGLVKTPVEFFVGALRAFGLGVETEDPHPQRLLVAMRAMGQEPFQPPNVAGWSQNRYWTNTAMAQVRFEIAGAIAEIAPEAELPEPGSADAVDALIDRLGLVDPPIEYREALAGFDGEPRGLVQLALAAPTYQMN